MIINHTRLENITSAKINLVTIARKETVSDETYRTIRFSWSLRKSFACSNEGNLNKEKKNTTIAFITYM
jgi:hypothetical protein